MTYTRYLTLDEVWAIAEAELGEPHLRDLGLLDAAVMRPQQTVGGADAYMSVHEKAAALMHSLARSHPLLDGNKRLALAAAAVFYQLNGYVLATTDMELIGFTVDVGEGLLDVPTMAERLKQWAMQV